MSTVDLLEDLLNEFATIPDDAAAALGKHLSNLRAQLAAQAAELERLREDAARLDWLDSTQMPEDLQVSDELKWSCRAEDGTFFEADYLREAIDAARAQNAKP